jgi:hypothetical protein
MIGPAKPAFTTPAVLNETPNFLVAGVPGAGKTGLLGLIGPDGKAMMVDTEGGTATFRSPWFRSHPAAAQLENIHVIDATEAEDCNSLVFKIESALDYLIRTKNADGYALFAVDSLTELQERFLQLHPAKEKRQAYGAFKEVVHNLIFKAWQAPLPTIFTTRLRADNDEVQQREIIRPAISPGAWEVAGLFEDIGLLELKRIGIGPQARIERVLDFGGTDRFPGKDRHGFGSLSNPTFVDLMARIKRGPDGASPVVEQPRPITRPPARPRPQG